MNLTIIPYFLAATIVDDMSWPLGPEYIFEVKKTTLSYRKPLTTVEMTCKLLCQHRIPDSLICSMPDIQFQTMITYANSTKYISPVELIDVPHLFEMKFNEHGVRSVLMKPSTYLNAVGIIRQIAEVFNVSTDLYSRRATYGPSQLQGNFFLIDDFFNWEQTLRGNCNTYNRVMHDDDYEGTVEESKFYLTVVPLADYLAKWKTWAPVLIEKSREDCIFSDRYVELLNQMKVTNYASAMKVMQQRFESTVEIVVSLIPNLWESEESRVFSEKVNLSLIEVIPALQTLPVVTKGEWLTLDKLL
ncbi:uncharacterized protein [Linepithema humile]|uniref:uncharacterized protein n=1 Tax=Linepithema humile TaxID=83485 RepID=UPI0006238563|nr:PREDICTED: uncharacterized protein LOC105670134 [Linepithema humile]